MLPSSRSAESPAFADPPASLSSLRSGNGLRSAWLLSVSVSPESPAGAFVSGLTEPSLEPDCAPGNGGAASAGAVPLAFPVSLRWRFASPGPFRRDAYASRRNGRPAGTVLLQSFASPGSFPAPPLRSLPLALRLRRGYAFPGARLCSGKRERRSAVRRPWPSR